MLNDIMLLLSVGRSVGLIFQTMGLCTSAVANVASMAGVLYDESIGQI